MPRCGSAAGQIAVSDGTNGTPANRELDWRCRQGSRSVHRGRCGRPDRLACVPAAGGAGCAGRRAGLTHPQRCTSTATAVMSAGMAGLGASVPTRSSRRASSPGGSRASWPASATSTMLPSTPRLQPEKRRQAAAGYAPPSGAGLATAGRHRTAVSGPRAGLWRVCLRANRRTGRWSSPARRTACARRRGWPGSRRSGLRG